MRGRGGRGGGRGGDGARVVVVRGGIVYFSIICIDNHIT